MNRVGDVYLGNGLPMTIPNIIVQVELFCFCHCFMCKGW